MIKPNSYKAQRNLVLNADREHEEMMQAAAKLAGADLSKIRKQAMLEKDSQLMEMFAAAKGD